MKGIPVVIAANGRGIPVVPTNNPLAPLMTVAENGLGAPITISLNGLGVPARVDGGAAEFAPSPAPSGYRWDFVIFNNRLVTFQGEPVVALVGA